MKNYFSSLSQNNNQDEDDYEDLDDQSYGSYPQSYVSHPQSYGSYPQSYTSRPQSNGLSTILNDLSFKLHERNEGDTISQGVNKARNIADNFSFAKEQKKRLKEFAVMDDEQSDRALRQALGAFSQATSNTPKQRGFKNNFTNIMTALNPAIAAHDEVEKSAETENLNLLRQLEKERIQQQNYEEKAKRDLEKFLIQREETSYHNRMMEDLARLKISSKSNSNMINPELQSIYDAAQFVPADKKTIERTAKELSGSSSLLDEIEEIEKHLSSYEKKYTKKRGHLNPELDFGALHSVPTKARNWLRIFGSKDMADRDTDYQMLKSKLYNFSTAQERVKRGNGVLPMGLITMFEQRGIVPTTNDNISTIKQKLANFKKEAKNSYDLSNAVLKSGRVVTSHTLPEYKKIHNIVEEAPQETEEQIEQRERQEMLELLGQLKARKAQGASN